MNDNIMKGMVPLMGIVMIAGVLQMIIPKPAEAAPPPEPAGFGCPYCTLFFDTMGELVAHIGGAHPGEPNFEEVDIGWS